MTGEEPHGESATKPDVDWSTYLVRASGLLLLVLLGTHLLDSFILHDIQTRSMLTFSERWSSPTWRALDWALAVLALVHGVLGLRPVVSSGIGSAPLRGVVMASLYGLVGVLISLVTFVALTFRFV